MEQNAGVSMHFMWLVVCLLLLFFKVKQGDRMILCLIQFKRAKFKDTKVKTLKRVKINIFKYIQVHLNKLFFSCNLFQKVKLSYILDSLHVK